MLIFSMSFVAEVAATHGGENVNACIQCGICAGSCPVANEMEYPPRKIIALIRAGMRDEVLSSSSMWYCLSCYMCTERCPRDVKPTELAYALESLAVKHGYRIKGTYTPVAHHSFVRSLLSNGRVYELGMMLRYYLRTNPFKAIGMLPVAFKLLWHKRLPLLPHRVRSRKDLNRVVAKFREIRGDR